MFKNSNYFTKKNFFNQKLLNNKDEKKRKTVEYNGKIAMRE